MRRLLALSLMILPVALHALPIDWHGVLGTDTVYLNNFRRTDNTGAATGNGSEVVPFANGSKETASFQSYVARLNPTIIINDNITFKGELTTGYARGGFLGDSTTLQSQSKTTFGNALYFNNLSNANSNLSLTQFYTELYTDNATFVVGRQPVHWGLGAIFHQGSGTWDRHVSVHDGLHVKLGLGNFSFEPYWAKINSIGSLTNESDVTEWGLSTQYKNPEKDLTFGVLLAKREGKAFNSFQSGTTSLGETDVTITDLYLKKIWGKLTASLEVPLVSGELGDAYAIGANTNYSSLGILAETSYKYSQSWDFGLDFGHVQGDDGNTSKFKALYLNPNYQVAHILFRYDLFAISDTTRNIYDSYITNATYLKLHAHLRKEFWTWHFSALYANANETAGAGGNAFDHENNQLFTATQDQDKNLGLEFDVSVDYNWNSNATVSADLGYLFTGDYYAFTNNTAVETEDNYLAALRLAITF